MPNKNLPATKAWLLDELNRIRSLLLEAKYGKRGTDIYNIDAALNAIHKVQVTAENLLTKEQWEGARECVAR